MKEKPNDSTGTDMGEERETGVKKKQTLLQKYVIPVEHLDFAYIEKCSDSKEVERILKVLRSGEEGYFPDLEKCVSRRLEALNPKSRVLRVEAPIVRSEYLGNQELDELKKTFLGWVDEIELANERDSSNRTATKMIFSDDSASLTPEDEVPIRQVSPGTSKNFEKNKGRIAEKKPNQKISIEEPDFIRPHNPNRIKSWDYDKWDKFDVDAELAKLEIEEMQQAERDKPIDTQKLREEQMLVEKLMKNEEVPDYLKETSRHKQQLFKAKERKSKSIFSKTSSSNSRTGHKNNIEEGINPELDDGVPDLEDVYSGSGSDHLATTTTPSAQNLTTCSSSTSVLLDPHNSANQYGGHSSKLQSFLSSATNPLKQDYQQQQQWRDPSRKSFIEELQSNELPNDKEKQVKKKSNSSSNKNPKIITENLKAKSKAEDEDKPKRRFKIHIEDLNMG